MRHGTSTDTGTGVGLQSGGARSLVGLSLGRHTGGTEEHVEIAPQDVTLGRRRPKWL